MTTLTFYAIAALALASAVASKTYYDKVRLTDIDALTLVAGKMTKARRSSPVPQLACVGGVCEAALQPVSVQCTNKGTDGVDVQWRCDADLDSSVKFGRLEVNCEGFAEPDDPFVLAGSCGLEYELVPTDPSKAKAAANGKQPKWKPAGNSADASVRHEADGNFSTLVRVGLIVLILWLIYRCYNSARGGGADNVRQSAFQTPRYGNDIRSPDEPPSYRSATAPSASSYSKPSSSTSYASSAASHLAAGAAGFALGRATAPSPAATHATTSTTTTTAGSNTSTNSNVPTTPTSQQKTGFATTKRR